MQPFQLQRALNAVAAPVSGAKVFFRVAGTTTPASVYSDPGLDPGDAHPYPIVADSAGRFPLVVYGDPAVAYRLTYTDATGLAGTVYWDADPFSETEASSGIGTGDINDGAVTGPKLGPGAVEYNLGFTPQEDFSALTAHQINLLLNRVGTIFDHMSVTPPAGALILNGGTIGDASSGASSLAHADAEQLFAMLWAWNATDSPILTDAGAGSTRGANAAADFAAHKRLTLPDVRGEFRRGLDLSRGIDSSRRIGEWKDGQFPAHVHTYASTRSDISSGGGQTVTSGAGSGQSTGSAGGVENSSENRPRSVPFPVMCWY